MGVRGGVQYDRCEFASSLLDPVHQLSLLVALPEFNLDTLARRVRRDRRLDVPAGGFPVDSGFSKARRIKYEPFRTRIIAVS
jgi:hypothetical protein